ncbi:hypothetical protein [Paenibacillus tepidiphilus]|uniref:hypothetical protein n=1 Tax=Paenibacillus tepidiphilus TaxID=2608683 RepID=UPI00123C2876|nr:hypothetical protein [Paenibacillus tepidiphilus]
MSLSVSFIARIILHLFMLLGLWIIIETLFQGDLKATGSNMNYRITAKLRNAGNSSNRAQKRMWIYRHLDNLLYLSSKKYEPGVSVFRFLFSMLFVFVGVMLTGYATFNEMPKQHSINGSLIVRDLQVDSSLPKSAWVFIVFVALVASFLPYFRLRYRYSFRRVKASYDLLEIVKIIPKFTHLSVDNCLYKTAEYIDEKNVLKQPLKMLSAAFAGYSNDNELRQEAQRFSKIVGTTFAIEFISNVLYAEREGTHHLKYSFMILHQSMEQQKETILTMRARNSDAVKLGSYGNVITILVCIPTFIGALGWNIYYKLQFQTTTGLIFMMFILATLILSFLLSALLSQPKLDYQ